MKLDNIEKPARYTGGELNSVFKENAELSFLLCFADVYEVGMSHLGINILYEVLNGLSYVYAERCFCPWTDMMDAMRAGGEPLASLETKKPMSSFDIVGFNLSYEMCYSNVLNMLELGGLPVWAKNRGGGMPIVVGGGACAVNPEPLADFFDLFVIGEGEEVTPELCALMRAHKKSGAFDRHAFLIDASRISGVYVPSLYDASYKDNGEVAAVSPKEGAPACVRRRYVADFNSVQTVQKPVLPYIGTVHDRCVLEIMRGCSNGCRFCQAGYITRPIRERRRELVMEDAREIIASTGYDEISLCSLSSGDYSEIEALIDALTDEFAQKRVSVSLPSLRAGSFAFAKKLQEVRKSGITFAPEAGTQRLRDVINKNISEEEILSAARLAADSGVSSVKLYFMIGLPTETYEDLDGIVKLVKEIKSAMFAAGAARKPNISVSASCFVPKAGTPFQWEAQDSMDSLTRKQHYLKDRLKIKGVKFNYHDAKTSFLEAVLARGDRRLSHVLYSTYKKGARFDAWQEHFSFSRCMEAFEECGIDPAFYANRERHPGEMLPYAHIDCLMSSDYLLRERGKAYGETTTPDCRISCAGCGLKCGGVKI